MSELELVCPECGEKRLAHTVVSTCPRDADRTATLARELAEARERRDLAEQRASDHAKGVIRTRLQLAEARERLARVEDLFAGGPNTPCRTVWAGMVGTEWAVECVAVPLDDLREALQAVIE